MRKHAHLLFAILFFLILNSIFSFPLLFAVFALLGAMFPDIDLWLRNLHRKALHNLWAMFIIILISMKLNFMDGTIALAFGIGFVSHLIADAITPRGIRPLWPLNKPQIKGPVKTGGTFELLIMIVLLFAIGYTIGIVQVRF